MQYVIIYWDILLSSIFQLITALNFKCNYEFVQQYEQPKMKPKLEKAYCLFYVVHDNSMLKLEFNLIIFWFKIFWYFM